jgi:hypothetical protein
MTEYLRIRIREAFQNASDLLIQTLEADNLYLTQFRNAVEDAKHGALRADLCQKYGGSFGLKVWTICTLSANYPELNILARCLKPENILVLQQQDVATPEFWSNKTKEDIQSLFVSFV